MSCRESERANEGKQVSKQIKNFVIKFIDAQMYPVIIVSLVIYLKLILDAAMMYRHTFIFSHSYGSTTQCIVA